MYDTATRFQQRAAFSDGDLQTASPAQVIVKCFDRLDADLDRALVAMEAKDHDTTNTQLGHAQELLGEMAMMIDPEVWAHADALLSVYDYVLRLLAAGNIRKRPSMIVEARHLLGEIGDGFRAAVQVAPPSAQPAAGGAAHLGGFSNRPVSGGFDDDDRPGTFSLLA